MIAAGGLQATQYRLAHHYLNQLRKANTAFQRGNENRKYWVDQIEQDWGQINHWQRWSVQFPQDKTVDSRLALDYVLDGYEFLVMRLSLQERLRWLADGLAEATKLDDIHAECRVLYHLVTTCVDLNALSDAADYGAQLTLRAAHSDDTLDSGLSLCAQGLVLMQQTQYTEAYNSYQECLGIFEQFGDNALISAALWGLGSIVNRLGRPQEAYEHFTRQLQYAEEANRLSEICSALTAVANSLTAQDKFHEAEAYARRCATLCRSLGFHQYLMAALFLVGECAMELMQYNQMLASFDEAYQIAQSISHQRGIIHSTYCLGYAHFRLENNAQAIAKLQNALLLVRQINSPFMLETVLETLALVLAVNGDRENVLPILHEGLLLAQKLDTEREKVRCLMVAVMVSYLHGDYDQATLWTGRIYGKTILDTISFTPFLEKLEAAFQPEEFNRLLAEGKSYTLDSAVTEALVMLHMKLQGESALIQ
ncbi:MAG: tetratricopeptide repeat protein [Anaerolineae bacterium]